MRCQKGINVNSHMFCWEPEGHYRYHKVYGQNINNCHNIVSVQNIWHVVRSMTSSTHSFAYSYRLSQEMFCDKLVRNWSKSDHNFLIFQPIFIRFSHVMFGKHCLDSVLLKLKFKSVSCVSVLFKPLTSYSAQIIFWHHHFENGSLLGHAWPGKIL